uniref:Uncharacterized protein n=1 Tax=Solanum lycopersicum TaxID=4081 RepID=A0A3Q7J6B2_SOLLC
MEQYLVAHGPRIQQLEFDLADCKQRGVDSLALLIAIYQYLGRLRSSKHFPGHGEKLNTDIWTPQIVN